MAALTKASDAVFFFFFFYNVEHFNVVLEKMWFANLIESDQI